MKYKKIVYIISLIGIIIFNINISSEILFDTNDISLSQIAFANDDEGGSSGSIGFFKCGQGTTSHIPTHGSTTCLYCGDCLSHWVFVTYMGECKLHGKNN